VRLDLWILSSRDTHTHTHTQRERGTESETKAVPMTSPAETTPAPDGFHWHTHSRAGLTCVWNAARCLVPKQGGSEVLKSLWPHILMLHFIQLSSPTLITNTGTTVKYYYNHQFSMWISSKVSFIPEFIIITPVFSVTWSFTNHSNMRIWWSRLIYDY